jgi:hypothetical protein
MAKPMTTNENNAWFGKLGTVETLIQDGQQPLTQTAAAKIQKNMGWNVQAGQKLTLQQVQTLMANGLNPANTKFDPFMVQVASELDGWGHITPQTAAIMHNQYGLRGGSFRNAPIRVASPPAPPPAAPPASVNPGIVNPFGTSF